MNNDSNNNVVDNNITPQTNNVAEPVVGPQPSVEQPAVNPTPVSPTPVSPAPVTPEPANPLPVTEQPTMQEVQPQTFSLGNEKPATEANDTSNEKKPMDKKMFIFIGLIIVLAVVFVIVIMGKNKGSSSSSSATPVPGNPATAAPANAATLEDVKIVGHQCINSKCNVNIGDTENSVDYSLNVKNTDFFLKLNDYEDYVKINISYTDNGQEKTITDYKLFVKSSNEDITSITTEKELREKLGLYVEGKYTETFKVTEVGMQGFGTEGDENYTYNSYTLVDSKSHSYEMKYKNPPKDLTVTEGKDYKVGFEVVNGSFGYEYYISSITAA